MLAINIVVNGMLLNVETCGRCSMDWNRDKYCNGDVAIKYSGCCHLCAEVKSLIQLSMNFTLQCLPYNVV